MSYEDTGRLVTAIMAVADACRLIAYMLPVCLIFRVLFDFMDRR
jgi:hypothetical protein